MENLFVEATVKAVIKKANPQCTAGGSGLRYSHLQAALCDELVEDLAASATLVNGKSLERAGSITEEVVLCSGLVDDGECSQDYCRRCMKPRCTTLSSYPTSWAYSRNIQSHVKHPYHQYN